MSTAVARQAPQKLTVASLLTHHRERLAPFLPRGITLERVIGEASLAARENPAILECTQESILRSVIRGLRMDMEIGVEFYLIPFSERVKLPNGQWERRMVCTGVAGYKGLANLAIKCGAVRSVQAHCVYEREVFEIEHGLTPILRHVPAKIAADRGPMIGAYYLIRLPRNEELYDFLPIADIEAVRAKSKQWGPDKVPECPWWWARKRAVIVGLGLVPKNPRFADAMRRAEEMDGEDELEELDEIPATPAVASLADPKANEPVSGDVRTADEYPGDDELEG